MAQKPDNRPNLFRIQILIIDGGLLVLRNVIDEKLAAKGITLSACLNNEKTTINSLKSRRVITQVQYDQLFPTSGQVPTISDMDITLIICLLRNLKCFGLNKKFNWNATPISTDLTVEADICRLKDFRNKISHIAETTALQANDFATWWNGIEQILVRLSPLALNIHQKIAGFKVCSLDPEEEKRVQEEIKKWKDYEAEVDRLKNEVTEVKNVMTEVTKRVAEVEKSQEEFKRPRLDEDEEKYQKHKKELKDGLFEFYKTRHSKVFLSPLFEEKDTPLASFYIRPEMSSNESLAEMFKTKNKQNREIYVLADAGIGKTAFSKYLANVWCQAHCPNEDVYKLFLKDDIYCMHEFDFLFLVLLRDSDDLCSIDDLIFEKIVSDLGLEEKLPENVLLKILKNEKCLVILDGLDEWTHPDKKCYRSPQSIPHRNDRENCTVLTTTRPWKLGVLDLNSCQLGKKVELTKLCYFSAVILAKRIFQRWKSYPNEYALERDVDQFLKTINTRQKENLAFVPLLLIYTTCLWCDGVQIGSSKCDLYVNIVELLLTRTIQKHGVLLQLQGLSSSNIPECFAEYDNCTLYYPLLMCLGKLAYYTLFNETKENTLVFDGSSARKHLTPHEMKFILHSGMLSESTAKTSRKKYSKVSFSHKTVQEFFAAIFISAHSDSRKIVLEKCKNVQDILDMSIICEFISRMNADRMCEISNDLMSVINEDEATRNYRTRTGHKNPSTYSNGTDGKYIFEYPLYNIQKMFMSCLQEMPECENIQLCLQDVFIDKDTVDRQQLQRLLKQNKTNIKSLYIDTQYIFSNLREIIDLFSLTDLSHIQNLHYIGESRGYTKAEINRILFPSLQFVTFRYVKWTTDEENLSGNLARVQNLQYLYIGFFTLPHKILETFFNFISGKKSMKELTLYMLDCKEHNGHNCKKWNLDLSQHSTLSKLNLERLPWRLQLNISTPSLVDVKLSRIDLDERSLFMSRGMLNIKTVHLERIKMSAGKLQNFITVLETLPQSVSVTMSKIKPYTEHEPVKKYIRSSQTFHVIRDSLYSDHHYYYEEDDGYYHNDDYCRCDDEIEFDTRKPSRE